MKTASVIAMNGTGYGTSNTGNAACSAAVMSERGTLSWEKPSPNPRPASPASARRLTYARCFAGEVPTPIPVVRSSSPPRSHGVGSSSSLTWTQRIGRRLSASPATRRSAMPGISRMSRTTTAIARLYGPYSSDAAGRADLATACGRFVQTVAAASHGSERGAGSLNPRHSLRRPTWRHVRTATANEEDAPMDIPQERKVLTQIPGPRSKEWMARRDGAMTSGVPGDPPDRERARASARSSRTSTATG